MQFFGQWSPPVDQVLYENYFKDKKTGFFLEAGACDGVELSCTLFFERLGWNGICIEPARDYYAKLAANRPRAISLNIGLSDTEEILEFTDVKPGAAGSGAGNGSFYHDDEHLKELNTYRVDFIKYSVPTMPYSKVIEDNGVKSIDLMCLDVEGLEFRVLNGMKNSKVLPSVMCIEYSYLGLKKLIQYMNDFGYHFNFISYNNAYFSREAVSRDSWFGQTNKECKVIDGQIAWVDF